MRIAAYTCDVKVVKILEQDQLALSLGGDHSVGLGTVAASLDHSQASHQAILNWGGEGGTFYSWLEEICKENTER